MSLLCVCLLGSIAACTGGATPGDEVLVTFGEAELLREEVDLFTPEGQSPEDSARYADQYIEQWIAIQAMATDAKTEVSQRDSKFQYQMARYRDQLISQMFTEKLVEEQPGILDVTPSEVKGYYDRQQSNFVAEANWYQFFYVKTALSGQYRVVNLMRSGNQQDMDELKSWARDNAVSWKLDSAYLPESELLALKDGYYYGDITRAAINTVYPYAHEEEGGRKYDFLRILNVVKAGDILPLSLVSDRIAQVIRNERKNALVDETKAMLVNQAKQTGKVTDFRK
ncbi:MAG: hypothetical protein NWR72_14495 [Bacteroidia bacterium]|nr:hypothetical protein [Bacteroidia bacterium]